MAGSDRLFFNQDTGQMDFKVDPFRDPSVPGPNTSQFDQDLDQDGSIDQAQSKFQFASAQADQEELTEEEKMRKEHEDRAHAADLKALEASKARIEAEKAAADAGRGVAAPQPSEQEQVTALGEDLLATGPTHLDNPLAAADDTSEIPEADSLIADEQGRLDEIAGQIPPEVRAIREQRDAAAASRGAEMRFAEQNRQDELAFQKQKAKALAENAAADAAADKIVDDKVNAHMGKIDAFRKQNPRKPTPSVLNLIGVFLGGLLAPSQGGRNVAAEMVMRNIQAETDVIMENRRTELSAMRQEGGVLRDERREADQDALERDTVTLQKLAGVRSVLQAKANADHLPAIERAHAREGDAALAHKEGAIIGKRAEAERDRLNRINLARIKGEQAAAARAAKGSGKGGRGGRSLGSDVASGDANYYRISTGKIVDFSGLSEKQVGKLEKQTSQIPLYDSKNDRNIKGFLAKSESQAKALDAAYGQQGEIGDSVQRIQTDLGSSEEWERLSIAKGYSTERGARIASEFADLMIAIKNKWELGAIQKPDMDILERKIGQSPETFMAYINTKVGRNKIKGLMDNMGTRGALTLSSNVTRRAGLPEHIKVRSDEIDVSSDLRQRNKPEPPDTAEKTAGNLAAGIEAGDDISGELAKFKNQYRSANTKSAAGPAGGVLASGPTISTAWATGKAAPPKYKRQIYGALHELYLEDVKAGRGSQLGVIPPGGNQILTDLDGAFLDRPENKKHLPADKKGKVLARAAKLGKYHKSSEYKNELRKAFDAGRDGTYKKKAPVDHEALEAAAAAREAAAAKESTKKAKALKKAARESRAKKAEKEGLKAFQ